MVYTRDDGEALFTSHAWRRLFEVRRLLVREFILEFLSTYRMSDTEIGLDVADTLCFQLGEVRRMMTWRQFILALGLHSEEEMAEAGFGAYWMIACSISGRGQGTEKGTRVDLFNLRTMDRGTSNVPYLLAQYLFRHAEGRKSEPRLSGGHFIGRLTAHFCLVSDKGLRGLSIIARELLVIDLQELAKLNICYACTRAGHQQPPPASLCTDYVIEDLEARGGERTFGLRPYHFTYSERRLTMEEMLYKFIDEGKREQEEMGAFIHEFRTTNELLFKERNNSLSELRFEVQELLRVINNTPISNLEVKGVTTRGGKTKTQDVQDNDTNIHTKEPLVINHDKPVESDEVLTKDQP
ncbi:hypothetical protein Tco_1112010 [Tanacetum coccineum]|uniref:Uncharacterized protein n=1 Tax=Tanacetum coccineum TaxID=301880 RepID=A0ABQ5INC8_9ASTR